MLLVHSPSPGLAQTKNKALHCFSLSYSPLKSPSTLTLNQDRGKVNGCRFDFLLAFDVVDEHVDGLAAHFFDRLADGGDPRLVNVKEIDVVKTDQGDVFGDPFAHLVKDPEGVGCEVVVEGVEGLHGLVAGEQRGQLFLHAAGNVVVGDFDELVIYIWAAGFCHGVAVAPDPFGDGGDSLDGV